MRYGFVIDQSKCIGCHACTVACKAENDVPLGEFRTWVKYIEKGTFPDTRRFFSVLRCNHCDNAPCVRICPVKALWRRKDGIVDFDTDICIGCKACMQACPYDALHINPATNSAEKCHFCAHRVEQNLQPACVIVCPEQAIIAGDLDNPATKISQLVSREQVRVRKPEQGTRPKVYYIDADEASLTPSAAYDSGAYLWGSNRNGPDPIELQNEADRKARTVYDVAHDMPWGWKVSAYLWTKSISAGVFIALILGVFLSPSELRQYVTYQQFSQNLPASVDSVNFQVAPTGMLLWIVPIMALIFLGITGALLIADLKHPERFWRILLRPQWRSWLAIGSFIITGYGLVTLLFLASVALGQPMAAATLIWPAVGLAIMTAIYTAFLFGQAEGRDLWQSPLMAPHLLVQAVIAGASVLLIPVLIAAGSANRIAAASANRMAIGLGRTLLAGLVLNLFIIVFGELITMHGSADAERAKKLITSGPFKNWFWWGVIVGGNVFPLCLCILGIGAIAPLLILATLTSLAGLLIFEHIWVVAGQSVPLS